MDLANFQYKSNAGLAPIAQPLDEGYYMATIEKVVDKESDQTFAGPDGQQRKLWSMEITLAFEVIDAETKRTSKVQRTAYVSYPPFKKADSFPEKVLNSFLHYFGQIPLLAIQNGQTAGFDTTRQMINKRAAIYYRPGKDAAEGATEGTAEAKRGKPTFLPVSIDDYRKNVGADAATGVQGGAPAFAAPQTGAPAAAPAGGGMPTGGWNGAPAGGAPPANGGGWAPAAAAPQQGGWPAPAGFNPQG